MSTLEIKDLHVSIETEQGIKPILKGVSLTINTGETHAIMGPNGSGKSTLAATIAGHPRYTVDSGSITLDGEDVLAMTVDQRARAGLFLAMQYPVEIPGVTMTNFLRTAKTAIDGEAPKLRTWTKDVKAAMAQLRIEPEFAERNVNEGFSGGEKKRHEILQLELLKPKFAVLDETDSGLDVDALKAKVDVESVQSFGLMFLMFNLSKAPFDKKEVRQALHYALDKDAIIKTALLGNATAATSYFQEGSPNYQKAATVYGFDADKAKSMLEAAGVKDLKVTLTSTDTAWVKDVIPLIKKNWDAVGVETTLEPLASAAVYGPEKVGGLNFDILAAPGDPSVFGNDADILLSWFYRGDTWAKNRFAWSDSAEYKEVQTKLDAALAASEADAKKLYSEIINIVAEEAPLYPIFHRKLPTAWDSKKLTGFQPLPTTGISFIGVGRTA